MSEKDEQKIWDAIAAGWSPFRQKPQKYIIQHLKEYAETWKPCRILDIGCGNCRNLIPFEYNDFDCYGIDFSEEMLKCAMEYGKKHALKIKIKQAYATKLPFPEKYFEYVLSISMFHNLDEQERVKALEEIKRVLKPRGKAVIAVWNKLQSRFFFMKKDVTIPWHTRKKVYQRYYHLFTHFELKNLLKREGFKILSSNIFGKMLIFMVEK